MYCYSETELATRQLDLAYTACFRDWPTSVLVERQAR